MLGFEQEVQFLGRRQVVSLDHHFQQFRQQVLQAVAEGELCPGKFRDEGVLYFQQIVSLKQ